MTRKIRVLYTIPNFDTSGSGKSVYDLVKNIDRTVFEPEICCTRNQGLFFKEVEKLNVKIHIYPFKTDHRPWLTFLPRVLKISAFFKDNKFDIIHSWNWSSDISEPLAAKLAGIPYVYTKKAMGWGSRYWTWKSKLSTKIIAVNQDMIDQYFGGMANKVVRFPLAIDTDFYKPSCVAADVNYKKYLNKDSFVILSVANLVAVKGIEILFEAVELLNNKTIKILIVGNDTNVYGLDLKQRYASNDNIIFAGKQLEVRPFLELADLFVIPTKDEGRREGIPNAPLEAMASECVVIGSNISGVKDVLRAFPNYLFEASDVDGLSKKISTVISMSQKDRSEVGVNMREQVIKEFSMTQFLNNHESLYLNIVK
jgi:glycosyltransferase involved in cell wall biosynthesis